MRIKHKNEIYHLISENDLNPNDFELENLKVNDHNILGLTYKNTPFKFNIRISPYNYNQFDIQYTQYGPLYSLTPFYPENQYIDFDNVYNFLDEWLNEHVKVYIEDLNEFDLWSQAKSIDIESINFDDKSFFSKDEKVQVKLAINELKFLITQNFSPDGEEEIIVNNRLDYLIESVERLNKFDWKSLVVSTIISISIALSMDTEKGRLLFELLKKVFTNITSMVTIK